MATHTATVAAQLAGVSYRQLDYWNRTGLVTFKQGAAGSGSRRQLSDADVRAVKAIALVKPHTSDSEAQQKAGQLARDPDVVMIAVSSMGVEPLAYELPDGSTKQVNIGVLAGFAGLSGVTFFHRDAWTV